MINLLDVALTAFIIWQLIRGYRAGFVRQTISLLSLFLALLLASVISPLAVNWLGDVVSRPVVSLIVFALILILVSTLSELASVRLLRNLHRHKKIDDADRIFGGALGFVFAVVAIWLLASIFSSSVWPNLSRQIKNSRVVQAVDVVTPPPPSFIAQIQTYLSDLSFPKVFIGLEPQLDQPVSLPGEADVRAVALQSQASVVKIVSAGCGNYLSDGSGFVAADGLVVTNAHVVAGVNRPLVMDKLGSHQSVVVYFDPDTDIAILRTSGLVGAPLPIHFGDLSRGNGGVVLGYPGGGGYSGVSAAVIEKIIAYGRNIYGGGQVKRPVLALKTKVVPGNSGGPFMLTSGEVGGLVFASSQTDENVGYALTTETLRTPLKIAASSSEVSSGRCMAR